MTDFAKSILSNIPGADPRPTQRSQTFSGLNDGPAMTASRIAGMVEKEDAKDNSPFYTSNFGQVIPHSGIALNIGGIPYQGDPLLLEKQQAFDRMKIAERIVHPAGSSAFGTFTTTKDVSHLTKAKLFQMGKSTPCYTRFSTVTYGREYPDSARNPRGFATKFYTEDGNYDLVGLSWPVFFVRDPMQGPDNIRSQQRNPKSFLLDYNAWFDFLANVPESQHAGLMLFSDYGTPVGWRYMSGFGCHTFRWTNNAGESVFVKYHWKSQQGVKQFTHEEALIQCGEDPDFAKRDLFDHIESGGDARWTLFVQVMKPKEAAACAFDPFDVTKVWPRGEYSMTEVGELILNRNPEDYHRDVEQAAFSPGSLVPGIEASPDTLLQWRMFFYRDAQYHRLGSANIHQIPVNCPFMSKFHSPDNFNGTMRTDGNGSGKPHYFPNSYHSTEPSANSTPGFGGQAYAEIPMQVGSNVVSRKSYYRQQGHPSEYNQVRVLYRRVMNDQQRANLHSNTARLLKNADSIVQRNYLIQLYAVAPEYARSVYDAMPADKKGHGYSMDEVAEKSETAHLVGLNPQFTMADTGASFMGMPISSRTA
ncbi:catalase [Phaffia rhodozyma]|uniref:Catalase n=1 Tax=Phaffia rhodozyma TaxID=264483 RepID=A0A0F7SNX1_PHARH|nr:catalase [Phaffia rhodozyma]